jgi:peptidoglycan/LPS O-acetylase OafA/YrhL
MSQLAQENQVPVSGSPRPVRAPSSHVPALDGLRAIAVLSVLAFHSGCPGAELGWLGVDLFFVLSGFLITTLLLSEQSRGGIRLGLFWGRRFLRLMPAYWLYSAAVTYLLLVRQWGWTETRDGMSPELLVTSIWLYFVNYVPQSVVWEHQWFVAHLWSLAVEEQFYLVWPIVLSVGMTFGRRAVSAAAWLAVAALLVWRLTPLGEAIGTQPTLAGRGLPIIVGCAVSLSLNGPLLSRARVLLDRTWVRLGTVLLLIGFFGVATVAFTRLGVAQQTLMRYWAPVLWFQFAAVIAMIWFGPTDVLARALAWRPAVFIGRISYGVYLYHMACHYLVWHVIFVHLGLPSRYTPYSVQFATFVAFSVGIATISYYGFERPFLRLKDRLRPAAITPATARGPDAERRGPAAPVTHVQMRSTAGPVPDA